MFWLGANLVYRSTNFPSLLLYSPILFIALCTWLGPPHPLIVGIHQCMCIHLIDFMGIHLLRYAHGNEHIKTHDVIHDTFATIVWGANFHVGQEQLHTLPSTTFNFSHWRVDIVLTKDGIYTLTNVVIVDLMWVDLLPDLAQFKYLSPSMQLKTKKKGVITTDTPPINFPLAIELYGYLHKHADVFTLLCQCHSKLERAKGPHLYTLVIFFIKKFQLHYKGCKHPPS
jgi:hypothetical protein